MDPAERKKRILTAVEAVNEKGYKFWQAAQLYGVPKSTLHDHVSRHCRKFTRGRFCVFSRLEEKKFVKLFKTLLADGYRLTPNDCRRAAYLYAELCGYDHKFNRNEQMAGRKWFQGFAKRNGVVIKRRNIDNRGSDKENKNPDKQQKIQRRTKRKSRK